MFQTAYRILFFHFLLRGKFLGYGDFFKKSPKNPRPRIPAREKKGQGPRFLRELLFRTRTKLGIRLPCFKQRTAFYFSFFPFREESFWGMGTFSKSPPKTRVPASPRERKRGRGPVSCGSYCSVRVQSLEFGCRASNSVLHSIFLFSLLRGKFLGYGDFFQKVPKKPASLFYFTFVRFQMRCAYSSMERSAAKWPAAAMLHNDIRFHFSLS